MCASRYRFTSPSTTTPATCRLRSVPSLRAFSAHSLAATALRFSVATVVIAAPPSAQAPSPLHSRAQYEEPHEPEPSPSSQQQPRLWSNHPLSPPQHLSPPWPEAGYTRSKSRTAPPPAPSPAHSPRDSPPASAPAPTTAAATKTAATSPDFSPAAPPALPSPAEAARTAVAVPQKADSQD